MQLIWAVALLQPAVNSLSCCGMATGQRGSPLVRKSRCTVARESESTQGRESAVLGSDSSLPALRTSDVARIRPVQAHALYGGRNAGLRLQTLGELRAARKVFNLGVISAVLLTAAYLVIQADLFAIISLYQTPDWALTPEVASSRAEICGAVLARLPGDWLHWYDASALSRPLVTKACTSAACYYAGDIVGQLSTGRDLAGLDLQRSSRSAAAGFIGHGPVAHYWLQFIDTQLSFGGAWWALPVKIAADQAKRPRSTPSCSMPCHPSPPYITGPLSWLGLGLANPNPSPNPTLTRAR